MSQSRQNQKKPFDNLGLLQKAQLLEKAKELGDKKKILKEGLKDKIQLQDQIQESQKYSSQDQKVGSLSSQLIQSSFAKKLENGQYLCTCCGLKLSDTLQATKHFNQEDHKIKAEAFKKKIEQKVQEKKEQLRIEEEQRQQQYYNQQQNKTQFMLVQEEEIIEDESQDQEQVESLISKELQLLEQLDQQTHQKHQSNNQPNLRSQQIQEEQKNDDLINQNQDEDDSQINQYEKRLIQDISEMEKLQIYIDEKKKQIVNKKRNNKVDLSQILNNENEEEFNFLTKRRKF